MKHLPLNHLKIGQIGESLVEKYLVNNGYKIKNRNFRRSFGEIDIVALKQGKLHFVEVKTLKVLVPRGTSAVFLPQDHYNYAKQQRQKRIILAYLEQEGVDDDTDWQIDLACVRVNSEGKDAYLELFEDLTLT